MSAAPAAAAAAAAGGNGGNGGDGIARRIAEVSMDATALAGVKGAVKVKHAKRRVTGGGAAAAAASGAQPLGGAVSEGPPELAAQARQVMAVTLTDRDAPMGPFNNIQVFFYDGWAERLDPVLQRNMVVTVSGPPQIVREQPASQQDHMYALAIAPATLLGPVEPGAPQLTIRIRPAHAALTGDSGGGPELVLAQGMDAGEATRCIEAFQSALNNTAAAAAAAGGAAAGGAAAARARRPTEYQYTELGDIVLPRFKGREVNVYGVIAGFTQPRKTNGTDHMCSLLLVHASRKGGRLLRPPQAGWQEGAPLDPEAVHPSQLVMGGAVVCNVFRGAWERLPHPLQLGEVVRLHRVKVNEFQNTVQLLCNRHAQFLLVRRRPTAPALPPPPPSDEEDAADADAAAAALPWVEGEWERVASSETHTFAEQDRRLIPRLWAWAHHAFLPWASVLDTFNAGPRTVEQVRKRLQNLPWRPLPDGGGAGGVGGEEEDQGPQPPAPPQPFQQHQQDDRQVGDFVGLVLAKPSAESFVVWDGTDEPAPAVAQVPNAVTRALHAALAAAHARRGGAQPPGQGGAVCWDAAFGEDAGEVSVPNVEQLGALMKEAGRLDVHLPGVHRWRFDKVVAGGKLAPGTWVRLRHLEVVEMPTLGPLGGGQQQGRGAGAAMQVVGARMNASINALPPYSLDVQRVACRFLAKQRQRAIPSCLMPFYHRFANPHHTGLPIAYVVEALGSSAPAVFALRVRMAGFWPQDLRRASRQLPSGEWTFFFSVRLEDATGGLDALVCGGGAGFFFYEKDVRPCDLADPGSAAALQRVQAVLAGRVAGRESYDMLVQSCLVQPGPGGGGRAVKRFRVVAIPDVRAANQGQGPN